MTTLKRAVKRETLDSVYSQGRERPVIVTIKPPALPGFRLKSTRHTYWLTAEGCYMAALRAQIVRDKKDKAKARKASRKAVQA